MKLDIEKLKRIKEFGKNLNILYVEDNQEARDATLDVLNEFFDNIEVAFNGLEGLEKFKAFNFDLIISDINMPKMDGITMLKAIREFDTDVPVLIISAYNESGYFIETIRLDVEGYILKPLELEQFIVIISKVIDKIRLKYENKEYQESLEKKVQEQLDLLRDKERILVEREKFASLGEMIDAIAHQFRQPLGIMRLQNQELEYLLKEELKLSNDEVEEVLTGSKAQVEHLIGTIEEFRRFFRTDIELEEVNLKDIFNSVRTLLKDEIVKHTTEMIVEFSDDIIINVVPNEFKHVMINLIHNSLDEFEKKDMDGRFIKVRSYDSPTHTIIEVEDNAGGIPEGLIDKIFDANFTTKGIEKGTGIGLYICKTILEKIQGSIDVKNTSEGALFSVSIPKSCLLK